VRAKKSHLCGACCASDAGLVRCLQFALNASLGSAHSRRETHTECSGRVKVRRLCSHKRASSDARSGTRRSVPLRGGVVPLHRARLARPPTKRSARTIGVFRQTESGGVVAARPQNTRCLPWPTFLPLLMGPKLCRPRTEAPSSACAQTVGVISKRRQAPACALKPHAERVPDTCSSNWQLQCRLGQRASASSGHYEKRLTLVYVSVL
jgi:hypothetical protein